MKLILMAAVAAAATATAASAQDSDGPWSGGYIGGHVGYGWVSGGGNERVVFDTNRDGTFGDTVRTAAGADAFSPGFCNGYARGATPASGCRKDKDGVNFAVSAGYDFQGPSSPLVFGGVVEVGSSGAKDAVSAFSTTPAFYTLERKVKYDVTGRVRAGYAFGRSLLYATGGLTYARVRNRFSTNNTANAFTVSGNEGAWGYKLGGGAEHMLTDRISLGVLYLYSSVKADDYRVRAGNSGTTPATNPFLLVSAGGTDFNRGKRFDQHSVSLSAAYRF